MLSVSFVLLNRQRFAQKSRSELIFIRQGDRSVFTGGNDLDRELAAFDGNAGPDEEWIRSTRQVRQQSNPPSRHRFIRPVFDNSGESTARVADGHFENSFCSRRNDEAVGNPV